MSLNHKMVLGFAHSYKIAIVIALAAMILSTTPASGGVDVIFYNDQAGLHSIVNSLGKVLKGVEDFEEMMDSGIPIFIFFDDPLESGVPNFPNGFLFPEGMTGLPNFRVQSNTLADPSEESPAGQSALVAISFGIGNILSDVVLNLSPSNSLDLIFTEGKSGVGFNTISHAKGNTPIVIRVYSTDNVLLGTTNAIANEAGSDYVGMWSPTALIGRINIDNMDQKMNVSAGADNIEAWQVAKPFQCGDKGAGDCHVVNGTPACDDLNCCNAVCAIDPFCCVSEWDIICVQEANDLCVPPPPNDLCADAISVELGGSAIGTTNGATIDSDFPICIENITAPGVWYSVIGNGNMIYASTCGGPEDLDTKINVYCNSCDSPICVGGNDDNCNIFSLHSDVAFCSQVGGEYLILVHGFGLEVGDFEIFFLDSNKVCAGPGICLAKNPCPWDLDDSGVVDTSDLLALFAQWGTAGPADFDGSGAVSTNDLLILFAHWGPCP